MFCTINLSYLLVILKQTAVSSEKICAFAVFCRRIIHSSAFVTNYDNGILLSIVEENGA